MNRIYIYHGSDHIIKEPIYGYGEIHNDYGLGFYCTQNIEIAKEWANKNTESGYVNKYSLDARNLKVLDLTEDKYSVLNWIAILMHNRNLSSTNKLLYKRRLDFLEKHFYIDTKDYDLVIGYRADDAYFKFPLFFIQNELSLSKLEEIYKLGDLGTQIVLISEKAFKHIKYISSNLVEPIYSQKYNIKKSIADMRFEQIRIEELNNDLPKIEDVIKEYDK